MSTEEKLAEKPEVITIQEEQDGSATVELPESIPSPDAQADHDGEGSDEDNDHAEDDAVAGAGAVHGLGGGEAVRVVLDTQLTIEGAQEVGLDLAAVDPRRAAALAAPRHRLERPGDADADQPGAAGLRLGALDEVGHDPQAAVVVPAGSGLADA